MNRKQKRTLYRILAAAALLVAVHFMPVTGLWRVLVFLLPYLVIGYDILWRAALNIAHGDVFDENFLMTVATVGAFFTGECSEGVAVMLFYQVGELFQSCAVSRSRKSIAALMDICPQYANLETDGEIHTVPPEQVPVGAVVLVKPGEKIPLDGVIEEGTSALDTAAITGESMPRTVTVGDTAVSGCINQTGVLRLRVTKPYAQSTVSQIVEMVENASSRKAKTEQFITKFARWYTPMVVLAAAMLAVIPSLITGEWQTWIHRALIFLVISCPCALVISVPLTFFGGIGGASRRGVLVKGGNYLEVLARAETVVFDKTGTLTEGDFRVTEICPAAGTEEELLSLAAHAEAYSDHPIANSVRQAYGIPVDTARIGEVTERAGYGVAAFIDEKQVLAGSVRMLAEAGVAVSAADVPSTVIHVAVDGQYIGYIVIADSVKADAAEAIRALRGLGVRRTVMLTGDNRETAEAVARAVGVDEVYCELLPGDKLAIVEKLLDEPHSGSLLFVGDGINDAPSLVRADAGIAMGAMGTDAAIEAADVVLMHDHPMAIPRAIRLSRYVLRIVRQNIVFALSVKALVMLLGALGYAGMWAAVFADVGVAVLAILNASRALRNTEK